MVCCTPIILPFPPPAQPHACTGQVAHAPSRRRAICAGSLVTRNAACGAADARKAVRPVFFFAASRTHAVVSGCGLTPGFCFPGQAESPHLRRAIRAAAPGNSRTLFFSSPRLARTRLFPGAGPRMAPVFPGRQKAHLLFPAAGRKPAGQKPAPNFHKYAKRGDKRSQAPGKRGNPPGRALCADPAGSSGFFRYVMGAYE